MGGYVPNALLMSPPSVGVSARRQDVRAGSWLVLAGGLGTRLCSAVLDAPKCLAAVAERPFLEWQLRSFLRRAAARFAMMELGRTEALFIHGDTFIGGSRAAVRMATVSIEVAEALAVVLL